MSFEKARSHMNNLADTVREEVCAQTEFWRSLPFLSAKVLSYCPNVKNPNYEFVMKHGLWPIGKSDSAPIFIECSSGAIVYRDGQTYATSADIAAAFSHSEMLFDANAVADAVHQACTSPLALRARNVQRNLNQYVQMYRLDAESRHSKAFL